jgi:hypothetical protein
VISPQKLSQQQRSSSSGFWWVVLLSAAAFAASLWASWQRPVWHDELYTLWLARMPLPDLLAALKVDSGPPLHYLLCHLLYLLVGWQEGSALGTFVVRLPSVVAFALLPWVVWWGTRQMPAARFWGPLLVVAWLPMFYFATEARAYALLALVNALVWILGPSWVERGGRRTVSFAALAACLPLLHYTGLVSLVMLPALVFFVNRRSRRRLLLAIAAATVPILVWSPVMLSAPPQSMAWVDTTVGPGRPGISTLAVLAPAGPFPALFELASAPVPAVVSLLVLGGVLAGVAAGAVRHWARRRTSDFGAASPALVVLALLPGAALAVLAVVGIPVYFAGRTETLVWALAVVLVVIVLAEISPLLRRVLAGTYVVMGLTTMGLWLADLPSRPPAVGVEVGQRLAPLLEKGDLVLVVGPWQLEVRHGIRAAALQGVEGPAGSIDVDTLPRSQSEHPGWFDRESLLSPSFLAEARFLERENRTGNTRIWLVESPALASRPYLAAVFGEWWRRPLMTSPFIVVNSLQSPD